MAEEVKGYRASVLVGTRPHPNSTPLRLVSAKGRLPAKGAYLWSLTICKSASMLLAKTKET